MTEKLLQFIWQFGYYNASNLVTAEGENLYVLFPGTLNKNSGPDFTAARVRVGETTFFGNIELHLRTSDWEKHRHQEDAAYGNVILHVVLQHDRKLPHAVPVLELEPRISRLLLSRYEALMMAESFIPCGSAIATVNSLTLTAWKERLLAERLSQKAAAVLERLQQSNGHWEETFWWLLARGFGTNVNGEAFEAIARSVPVTVLAKHKSSLHQIEALLMGQAGLLEEAFGEDYPAMLQREYRYLQKKLSLKPAPVSLQFLRMRPGNFPTIRLAQLAVLVQQSQHLFSKLIQAETVAALKPLFTVTATDFWHYHYTFRQPSAYKMKSLGADTLETIFINTIIPVVFAYGIHLGEEKHKEKALRWLEEIKAEKNSITAGFTQLGLKAKTAYDTQALLHLKNEYCQQRLCLQCAVGNALLKRDVLNPAADNLPAKK